MLKQTLMMIAAGSAMCFSTLAPAGDFYLNGHLGQAMIEERPFVSYEDDSDISLGVRLGWNVNTWLSIELGYASFGSFKSNCCGTGPFQSLDYDTTELGLRGRMPLGDSNWFGLARAGVHRWDDGTGRGSRTDTHYGIGVGYQLNERLALGVDYDLYQTDNAFRDVDRLGVSAELSF